MVFNEFGNGTKKKGYRGLALKKRGVQGGKKINGKQAAEVRQFIKYKLPDQLKLPFGLWTREAIQQLILDRFAIELSRWQVGRYLKSWGYTSIKPISMAFEQKPEKVKEWLEKEYPAIKKEPAKKMPVFILVMRRVCEVIIKLAEVMHLQEKRPLLEKPDNGFHSIGFLQSAIKVIYSL